MTPVDIEWAAAAGDRQGARYSTAKGEDTGPGDLDRDDIGPGDWGRVDSDPDDWDRWGRGDCQTFVDECDKRGLISRRIRSRS